MSGKKKFRVVLDALLTVMLVFEMFIQFTGDFLHEVVGFAFFATIVVHLALSARWMRGTAGAAKSGTLHGKRAALAVMGILLALDTAVLGVSSVAISGLLASAGLVWTLGSYATWATIHAVSAYGLCALVTVHLAMHWAFLASALKVSYNPARRRAISTGVHAVAAVSALALGVMAVQQGLPRTASAASNTGAATSDNSGFGTVSDLESGSTATGNTSASATTVSSNSSASVASASSDRESGTRSGKHSRTQDGAAATQTANTTANASSTANTAAPSASAPTAPAQSETSTTAGASSSSMATVSGTCTLCHKQCPLSSPRCNKPYDAGLI